MKIFKQISIACLLLGSFFIATTAYAGPDCTCRHKDGEAKEGQTVCIKTHNGMTLARCERVLNNTSWKMLEDSCPFSQIDNPKMNINTAG